MSSSVLFPTPITLVGSVLNPFAVKFADNQQGGVQAIYDQGGSACVAQRCGTFAVAAQRNSGFQCTASNITITQVANNAVSTFGIYNPVGSGVWLELVTLDLASSNTTTVVGGMGIYFSTAAKSALATFTTAGTVNGNVVGAGNGKGQFYSAVTHSGTPSLQALCGAFGAVTNSNTGGMTYRFDGTVLLGPGILISVLGTTAAMTNMNVVANWIEYNQ